MFAPLHVLVFIVLFVSLLILNEFIGINRTIYFEIYGKLEKN